jgi:excisionase family DNA binding protein
MAMRPRVSTTGMSGLQKGDGPLETLDSELLLTPTEAARRLSVGRTRLYQLIGTGELASVRVGSLRRIPARSLRAYVNALLETQVGGPVSGTAEENHADSRAG